MDVTELSIHKLCWWSFPKISLVVTVTSQLFVDKQKPEGPWCNFCISEIWDSDLFHSPVSVTVMFRTDSPLLTTICCVGFFVVQKTFQVRRDDPSSHHSFWSKTPYIEIFHTISACSYFFLRYSDTRSPAEQILWGPLWCCQYIFQ